VWAEATKVEKTMWDLLVFAAIGLLTGAAARLLYPGRRAALCTFHNGATVRPGKNLILAFPTAAGRGVSVSRRIGDPAIDQVF